MYLRDGFSWKDLLAELQRMTRPPQLIVSDRFADERLWAEVLNLGGYDLLLTPFVEAEVLHTVATAWEFGERDLERASQRPQYRPGAAKEQRELAAKTPAAGAA